MKYEWTDWIRHVPGQELPAGFWGVFEFLGDYRNGGKPYQIEGMITASMKGDLTWRMTTPHDPRAVMLLRYKLRVERDEAVVSREEELVTL